MAAAQRFPAGSRISGERSSRFIEPPMTEYTPDNSIYDGRGDDGMDAGAADASTSQVVFRATNAVLHLVACVVLLAIVATFLSQYRGLHVKNMT